MYPYFLPDTVRLYILILYQTPLGNYLSTAYHATETPIVSGSKVNTYAITNEMVKFLLEEVPNLAINATPRQPISRLLTCSIILTSSKFLPPLPHTRRLC